MPVRETERKHLITYQITSSCFVDVPFLRVDGEMTTDVLVSSFDGPDFCLVLRPGTPDVDDCVDAVQWSEAVR